MEIVMVCPKNFAELRKQRLTFHMENCLPSRGINLTIPLEAVGDIGRTYSEAK